MNTLSLVIAGLRAIKRANQTEVIFTEKGRSDFVSEEDILSDQAMVNLARSIYPALPIFSEESTELPPELPDEFIAIDPLDGSNNRQRGRDAWGITATLVRNYHPVEAAAYVRYYGSANFLYAKERKGAFIRKAGPNQFFSPVRIDASHRGTRYSVPGSPKESMIPSAKAYQKFLTEKNLWKSNVAEGCATANVMAIVRGSTDIYVNAATGNILDLAGMQLIFSEAGGYVVDSTGNWPKWKESWLPVIFSRNEDIAAPFIMR